MVHKVCKRLLLQDIQGSHAEDEVVHVVPETTLAEMSSLLQTMILSLLMPNLTRKTS